MNVGGSSRLEYEKRVNRVIDQERRERGDAGEADHPEESVLAIALDHGFSSAATFARAFKAHFGNPDGDGRGTFRCDLCVPIRPL